MSDDSDLDRVQDRAERRQSERASTIESVLEEVERHLGDVEYPVRGEELAASYGAEALDLPNETDTAGRKS